MAEYLKTRTDSNFSYTFVLAAIVGTVSVLTAAFNLIQFKQTYFAFQSTQGWVLYFVLLTGPFNIYPEGDIFGNFIILMMIMATAEYYLRKTKRTIQCRWALVSSVISTYILSLYLIITESTGVAGTSIVGFSMLVFLIAILLFDMVNYIFVEIVRQKNFFSVLMAGGLIGLAAISLWVLQYLVFQFYIDYNTAAQLHMEGGILSLIILAVFLKADNLGLGIPVKQYSDGLPKGVKDIYDR